MTKGGTFFTTGFGQFYDLCVVFVVEGDVFRELLHKKIADLMVFFVASQGSDAHENTPGISIDNEGGAVGSVEENGVCCFRADAWHGQQPCPTFFKGPAAKIRQAALPFHNQESGKVLQPNCFLPEKARGPDQSFELMNRCLRYALGRKKPRLFEVG